MMVHIVACVGQRRVMWFNMREEPVIYINGNPYVVREANKPFANLEYTGVVVYALCIAVICLRASHSAYSLRPHVLPCCRH